MNNALSTHTRLQRDITYWHVRSAHQGVTYSLVRAGIFPRNRVPRAIYRAIPSGRGKRACDKVHYTHLFSNLRLTYRNKLFAFDVCRVLLEMTGELISVKVRLKGRFKTIETTATSRKLLRIKVTPDLHLTYSKNGGNLELVLKMKNIACISILLTKHVKYTYLYLFKFVLYSIVAFKAN